MKALLLFILPILASTAFAAGSESAVTERTRTRYEHQGEARTVEKVVIDWTADDSDGSVPDLTVTLKGYVVKVITNPGSTAPTDKYDLALGDPDDSSLDALGGLLADRATATTEQVYGTISGSALPVFLAGDYTLSLSNNSVNSATGQIIIYLVDRL